MLSTILLAAALVADVAAVPQITGPCQWGIILQDGRNVWVTNHPDYDAWGEIVADGTLHLTWRSLVSGKIVGHGIYEIHANGKIDGEFEDKTNWWNPAVGVHNDLLREPKAKECVNGQ